MKRSVYFNILLLTVFTSAGCTNDTFVDSPYSEPLDFLNMFTASIEDGGSEAIPVIWAETNRIGVFAGESDNKCFVVKENMNSSAVFSPEDEVSIDGPISRIYAYYPYSESSILADGKLTVSLPATQTYNDGGPSPETTMLVGTGTTRSVVFKQVYGAVKLKLSSSEFGTVKKITVSSLDNQPLAGQTVVDLNYDVYGGPSVTVSGEAATSIVLDCGDGVEIPTSGKDFYFVVPPASYDELMFTIENTEGETFESRPGGTLTVNRGQIADAGLARVYIEEHFYGKANCIRHDEPGTYTFDVSPYYTTDSYGYAYEFNEKDEPVYAASADLLWQSVESMISGISLSDDKKSLTFTANRTGNALIAIYDAEGEILWSYHIWIAPVESVVYPNGYEVHDRNLGAINNTKGDHGSWGLYYQWGRKDPLPELEKRDDENKILSATYFDKDNQPFEFPVEASKEGVDQYWTTKHPTTFLTRVGSASDWVWETGNNRLWGNPEGYNHPNIATLHKSVYDPCPEGWMVAPVDLWTANGVEGKSFENNPYDKANEGRTLTTDGINQWYPAASYYHSNYPTGNPAKTNPLGRYWTSSPTSDDSSRALGIIWGTTASSTNPEWACPKAYGFSVRCVKVVSER